MDNQKKETCKDCTNIHCALYNSDFEACRRIEDYRKEGDK